MLKKDVGGMAVEVKLFWQQFCLSVTQSDKMVSDMKALNLFTQEEKDIHGRSLNDYVD